MSEGLPIKSSTSQEAIKLYDCALTQVCPPYLLPYHDTNFLPKLVGWYDDTQQENGLVGTVGRMVEADPNFGEHAPPT